ncbi:hypothetical protein GALMADRAFT_252944 [Galerina marginata CBS 339.88]|uniref:Uncharacterized protein n=1 Tax=Galerina marginata (strain CBS 339.88) TaxID=685588 RepID=A0A067T123_GALM3|nr:hypothetical protein GALMADRAFT_252944 [Galerina marginata CBS 339.88]
MVQLTNMFSRAAVLALVAFSTVVNADLKITSPSSTTWWVAKSQNLLTWTCKDTTIATFTVLVGNTNIQVQAAPIAIIGIQNNFDCSINISQDQANQAPGTGWQVLLANPLNNTEVYATSEPFEVKPLGSLYPSQVTPSPNASGSASPTDGSAATKPTSAATSGKGFTWGVLAGAVAGAVGMVL